MFTVSVTSTDGTTTSSPSSEQHVLALLRRGVRYSHCTVEATRSGGAVIEQRRHDGTPVPKKRTIAIEPAAPLGRITPTVRRDLECIDAGRAYMVTEAEEAFQSRVGRIAAGFAGVPPAASARLIARGLVVVGAPYAETSNGFLPETRVPVRVSLAARLALLSQDHRTSTIEPAGYVRPADVGMRHTNGLNKPGRRAGMVYDFTSPASCTCRQWTGTYDGRDSARRAAREHRQAVAAELVASLD